MPAPEVIDTIAGVRAAVAAARMRGARIAFVPTMGALHDGHLDHVRAVTADGTYVVVSIFVNPLQFGPGEDLARYPRTLAADLEALARLGVDAVFAPTVAEMYPDGGVRVTVSAGEVGARFEGAARPGHFDGALTVVAKLLAIVGPDLATFGEKDAQQLWLVQRMVADLSLPVEIVPVPTRREPDGLAMSSRNRFLDARQRQEALALSRALTAAAAAPTASAARAAARGVLAEADAGGGASIDLDYVDLVDPASFAPVGGTYQGPVIAIIAAKLGAVRLIDNARFTLG